MVWNGTIVKEVSRYDPADVTVGEDPKNTFVVPAPNLPSSFKLFHYSKDKQEPVYLLHLMEGMGGKLTVRDTTMSVRDFIKSPAVHPFETGFRGEVEPGDWGLISVGDVGFFWQFVPPADRVKAALSFDKNLALIGLAMASLMALIIIIGYVFWDEKARKPSTIAARQAKFILEKHQEPPKPEPEKKEEGPKENVGKRHMGKEGK